MRKLKIGLIALFALAFVFPAEAYKTNPKEGKVAKDRPVNFRVDCTTAEEQIDQDVNNVRARLTTGGDVWWDRSNGSYIVPKVANDETPVSSIYAGAVWLGGIDPGGNLKVACQTYGNNSGDSDFWAGPIDPTTGQTSKDTCDNWDRFFVVTKTEIDEHLFRLQNQQMNGVPYTEDQIPLGVKGWPGRANPFFEEINAFSLPTTDQGLAGFWDENGDNEYRPLEGDFPIIEIRGCLDLDNLPPPPDQMIFWIYNDAGDFGNVHGETEGDKINMEVQVQAFAYSSDDEINNMTFQRYKLINRAQEDIDSTYFAMWVDADVGCGFDDFVGCDTARSLAYIYNADPSDGIGSGISCDGTPTYETDIPIVGIDYFRGPLDENRNEIGMSSFTYYNNGGQGQPPGTEDPGAAIQYYRYLSGSWADGSPFEFGGDGYQENTFPINYAFPSPPNGTISTDWSCCHSDSEGTQLPELDRRTIQASGPFLLQPGAVNELIIGVVWVADQVYPCPKLNTLLFADETAQALFNNCFDLNEGPDAPDADWIELDREIIAVLSNDTIVFNTNNARERYLEVDAFAPADLPDSVKTYVFEGYLIYQLKGPSAAGELDNPDKARLIQQVDKNNGITKVYNWTPVDEEDNPDYISEPILVPSLKVDGADQGIRHTFRITNDAFADGDTRLINHKKYYYTVRAYAHNEYAPYDPVEGIGQKLPYIAGGGNVGDADGLPYYVVIPRPITDKSLNAAYGLGAPITRIDGVGIGGRFVDITDETRERMFVAGEEDQFDYLQPEDERTSSFNGVIDYIEGAGPIEVQVYNPLEVRDGDYELTFIDENMDNDELDNNVRWRLTDLNDPSLVIESEKNISTFNDEILAQLGITVGIGQTDDVGVGANERNGAIGTQLDYVDGNRAQWFNAIPDEWFPDFEQYPNIAPFYFGFSPAVYDYADTDLTGSVSLDPFEALTNIGDGFFFPFMLGDYRTRGAGGITGYLSPMWKPSGSLVTSAAGNQLPNLRNIDLVYTSDKSKWSRCLILEMRSPEYDIFPIPGGATPTQAAAEGDREHMTARFGLSVGKEAGPDGLPMVDNEMTTNKAGDPIPRRGMGWFPGYAVDVETGERLNVFFGENSVYDEANGLESFYTGTQLDDSGTPVRRPTGRDMMFNPTNQPFLNLLPDFPDNQPTIFDFVSGGQHWIYVDGNKYDRCEALHKATDPDRRVNMFSAVTPLRAVQWSSLPLLPPGTSMLSYANGLIPNDLVTKIRVDNPYQVSVGTDDFNGYPTYRFSLDGVEANDLDETGINEALDLINVVPNPYYAYSEYENSRNDGLVKITNLPAKCIVTIYSLDGKFIRRYNRDEVPGNPRGSGIPTDQILPDVEWDLKNNKGISISSGVYLIHVDATAIGWGERTVKWFGINNKFDSSGL